VLGDSLNLAFFSMQPCFAPVPSCETHQTANLALLEQLGAFSQDAIDNKTLPARVGKLVCLSWPSAARSPAMVEDIRFVAANVTGTVIANSGHWLKSSVDQP
jgi:hypothetical protein